MRRLLAGVSGAVLLACVSTQVTQLAGFDPQRAPTCWQAVKIYASAQAVDTPYVEIAYLHTSSTDPVADEAIIKNMRQKAAAIGANGVLFKGIQQTLGNVGLVSGALQTKPTGEAVALWIPRDSAAARRTCADSTAAH